MQINKMLFSLALLLTLFGLVAAAGETAAIGAGICSLFTLINMVLTAVIFLLIVAAAVVYAGGQLLGAETRARATVWATSMFIGALIGVLIYIIAPMVLGAMSPTTLSGGIAGACGGEPSTATFTR